MLITTIRKYIFPSRFAPSANVNVNNDHGKIRYYKKKSYYANHAYN